MCTFCTFEGEVKPDDKICTLVCSDGRKNVGEGWGSAFAIRTAGGILRGLTPDLIHDLDLFVTKVGVKEIWLSAHHDCRFAALHNIKDDELPTVVQKHAASVFARYAGQGVKVRSFIGRHDKDRGWIYEQLELRELCEAA